MRRSLYQVIAEDLITAIDNGKLKPGDDVWSLKDMKERYGVSHLTALKTFKILSEQNRIERQNGGRYRVAYPENNRNGNRIISAFRMLSEYNTYDNFGNRIISGIMRGCLQKGFSITALPGVIAVSGRLPTELEAQHLAEEITKEKNCSGVIFDMRFSDELLEKYLLPVCNSIPSVLVGRNSRLPINTVSIPNQECGEAAAKLAIHSGAGQYVILGVECFSDQDIFFQSFSKTLHKEGIDSRKLVYMTSSYKMNNQAHNLQMLEQLLHLVKDFSCKSFIIALNGFASRRICNMLQDNGLKLHDDFCLLSYGGFEISYNFTPRIAEIAVNAEEIGYIAADIVTGSSKRFQKEHYCGYRIDFNETL